MMGHLKVNLKKILVLTLTIFQVDILVVDAVESTVEELCSLEVQLGGPAAAAAAAAAAAVVVAAAAAAAVAAAAAEMLDQMVVAKD
jgi:hypothetical protein